MLVRCYNCNFKGGRGRKNTFTPHEGMKLLKLNVLNYVESTKVSTKYVFGFTGSRVKIFNKEMQLIKEIPRLDHVYTGSISPDEKKLLLVSTGNRFYILSLETFELKKYTVCGREDYNLEGRGCWSFDGKEILLCANGCSTGISALRIYDCGQM